MPYLTPETIPSGLKARVILIPDDLDYLAIVSGALLELTEVKNFEKFGTATPEDVAFLFWEMYQRFAEGVGMIGQIFPYIGSSAPAGALACDGGTYSRSAYPALYAALDASLITDADNFRTPDLRGRTIIGTGQGTGLSARAFGSTGGSEAHQLTVGELAQHSHTYVPVTLNLDLESPGVPDIQGAGIGLPTSTGSAGDNLPHENMQPFMALNYYVWAR